MSARRYAIVTSRFWTGTTGRVLRSLGRDALLTALYLVTGPHANAIGLYYLPIAYMADDLGSPIDGASEGLRRVSEGGFCRYDKATCFVWVVEMARHQIGDELKAHDKRAKWIREEFAGLPSNPFLAPFYEKYGKVFNLPEPAAYQPTSASPIEAPSKPHRSQEQDHDLEQEPDLEQDHDLEKPPTGVQGGAPPVPPTKPAKAKAATVPDGFTATVAAWFAAFKGATGSDPRWSPAHGAQLKVLLRRFGAEAVNDRLSRYVQRYESDPFYTRLGLDFLAFVKAWDALAAWTPAQASPSTDSAASSAWAEVLAHVRTHGRTVPGEWTHPRTADVLRAVGGIGEVATTQEGAAQGALRARFLAAWKEQA